MGTLGFHRKSTGWGDAVGQAVGAGQEEGGLQGSEKRVLESLETHSRLLRPATEKPTQAGPVHLDHMLDQRGSSWKEGAACSLPCLRH